MLQFWKRSGRKENARSDKTSKTNPERNIQPSPENIAIGLQEKSSLYAQADENETIISTSRLSKSLHEIFLDKSALSYFIQFMDSKSALSLIKFWLDVESFRTATAIVSPTSTSLSISCGDISQRLSSSDNQLAPIEKSPNRGVKVSQKYSELCDKNISSNLERIVEDIDKNSVSIPRSISDNVSQLTNNCIGECHRLGSVMSLKSLESNISSDSVYLTPDSETNSDTSLNKKNVDKSSLTRSHSVPVSRNVDSLALSLEAVPYRKQRSVFECIYEDAVRIIKKYISSSATHLVVIPEDISNGILAKLECNLIDAEMFASAQNVVYERIEKDYFNDFLRSEYHCKHQIDVLTSGEVFLEDILYNETALFYFMEFLEQESPTTRDLVEFWLAAVNFRQFEFEQTSEHAQSDAVILYDKYFSLQATNPLNLGNEVRFAVEESICREEGPLPSCFDIPLRIAQAHLQEHYLTSFLTSQLFFKYLSELINTIQTSPWPKYRHKKSGSDASSEISVQNTLLAMDSRQKSSKFDMSIENSQLTDPDSLWRRNQIGLTFGRVNSLGRFQSDLEREPEQKNQWRFSRAVKKFINKDEESKEEMAWQVAEMIVKDITNVTLNHQYDTCDS